MKRKSPVILACLFWAVSQPLGAAEPASRPAVSRMDEAMARTWLARWEKNIVADSRNRYCDKETGEQLGWLVSPFLNGFYYGYLATGDTQWIDRLIDWSDAVIKRGVKEPDGFVGWPKARRRQHRRRARLHHGQPAGRGHAPAPDGPHGRRDPQDARPQGQVRPQGRAVHPAVRAGIREVGRSRGLA